MTEEQNKKSCLLLTDIQALCQRRRRCENAREATATPLHESCCHGRMRICAVNGDRKTCARMAHLGLLPGSEVELLCKGGRQQCVVKVNGSTISLDHSTAASILVMPA